MLTVITLSIMAHVHACNWHSQVNNDYAVADSMFSSSDNPVY